MQQKGHNLSHRSQKAEGDTTSLNHLMMWYNTRHGMKHIIEQEHQKTTEINWVRDSGPIFALLWRQGERDCTTAGWRKAEWGSEWKSERASPILDFAYINTRLLCLSTGVAAPCLKSKFHEKVPCSFWKSKIFSGRAKLPCCSKEPDRFQEIFLFTHIH